MWPQNRTLPLFSLSHFWPSVEITWMVVLALSVLKDIDFSLASSERAGVAERAAVASATAATVHFIDFAWIDRCVAGRREMVHGRTKPRAGKQKPRRLDRRGLCLKLRCYWTFRLLSCGCVSRRGRSF